MASANARIVRGKPRITPGAAQPVTLQEPDWSGMFIIGEVGPVPLLRDAARGWTYFNAQFSAANVKGVTFAGLFRVSDSGLAETQWRVPDTPQFTEQYLAADGTLIGRAYVKNSATYEKRWYRLQTSISGPITPVEISSLADLPLSDSVDLTQNGGLDPRPLPLADGSLVTYEVAFVPEPTYTYTYTVTLRKRDRKGNVQWSHLVTGRARNLAADASGRVYMLGEAVSIDNISDAPPVNRLATFDLVTGRRLVQRYPPFSLGSIAEDGTVLSTHATGRWSLLDSTRNDASGDRVSTVR